MFIITIFLIVCILYQNYYLQVRLSVAILYSNRSTIQKIRYLIPIVIYILTYLFYLDLTTLFICRKSLLLIATLTTGSLVNYLVIEYILLHSFNNQKSKLSTKDNILLIVVPLGIVFINIVLNIWCLNPPLIIAVNVFSMLIMFTLFHFLNYLLKERSNAFIKEKVLKDNTEQLLQTKHDLLKEYRMIQHMLKSKKIKSAERIIDSQVGVIEKIQPIFNTGHEELDYILNIKQKEAGENHIKIEANLKLSSMIRTNYGELSMILWNVLDNAIEASKMVPENQRTINLRLDFNHGVLLIIAENPCNHESVHFEDGIYKTSKEDKVNHGHGLKIIKKLAKKYEGTVKIEHKDKKFSIEILLFLN